MLHEWHAYSRMPQQTEAVTGTGDVQITSVRKEARVDSRLQTLMGFILAIKLIVMLGSVGTSTLQFPIS